MNIGIVLSKLLEERANLPVYDLIRSTLRNVVEVDAQLFDLSDTCIDQYDCVLCIGIHSLSDKDRCFCVHPCGNWGSLWDKDGLVLGGKENVLCGQSSSLFSFIYHSFLKHNSLDFEVHIEATHHGPAINKPVLMLEIGSSAASWENSRANYVVFQVLVDVLQNFKQEQKDAVLVLGGDHYMGKISTLMRTGLLVSHLCPSSQLHAFNQDSLSQVMQKTTEKISSVLIDVSGVGQHYNRLTRLVLKNNLRVLHMHDFL